MKYNPKYEINLNRVFSRAYSSSDAGLRDQLRSTLKQSAFRATFGKMVIDKIIERTLKGIDRHNLKFEAYSKSYIDSDVFKIYQKSPAEVNLELSGEMLSSMRSHGRQASVTITLVGALNQAKAHGHIHGIKKKGGGRVVRDFLGLPDNELDAMMVDAISIFRNEATESALNLFENTSLSDFFGQVGNQQISGSIFTNDVIAEIARRLGDQ